MTFAALKFTKAIHENLETIRDREVSGIKQLHRQASEQGQGQLFMDALRSILGRLQNDLNRFGEPLYRLPALKLLVYQAIVPRVVVDHAVQQELPLVILKGAKLLE